MASAIQLPSIEFLERICYKAKNMRDSCLVALLFLSGRRIGEVLELKLKDFIIRTEEISFTTFNEKTFRSYPTGKYLIQRGLKFYEVINPTFPTVGPSGEALSPFILKHLESLTLEDYVFYHTDNKQQHIGRSMAYRILISLEPNIWLHWLRHERFTQLAKVYKDDPLPMHDFTFHKRFETTLGYIRKVRTNEKLKEI